MNINLANKTLLITGGLGDFGKVIVKKFLSYNAKVIITTTKNIKEKKSKKLDIFQLNFNDKKSLFLFEEKLKKINKIDYLINNAGINILNEIYNIKKNDLENIINVNLVGPIWLTKLISTKMKKNKFGRIINISSIYGSVSKEKRSLYSSSKFGLNGLTKSAALDLAKFNILVNSISPGIFDTKLTRQVLKKKGINKVKKDIPLGKIGDPKMIANLCLFLCSDFNNYITGQNIIIDGGYTSQ